MSCKLQAFSSYNTEKQAKNGDILTGKNTDFFVTHAHGELELDFDLLNVQQTYFAIYLNSGISLGPSIMTYRRPLLWATRERYLAYSYNKNWNLDGYRTHDLSVVGLPTLTTGSGACVIKQIIMYYHFPLCKLQIASPLGHNKLLLKHSFQHQNWTHILIYEVLYLSLWFYKIFSNKLNIINSRLLFFLKHKD